MRGENQYTKATAALADYVSETYNRHFHRQGGQWIRSLWSDSYNAWIEEPMHYIHDDQTHLDLLLNCVYRDDVPELSNCLTDAGRKWLLPLIGVGVCRICGDFHTPCRCGYVAKVA